MNILVIGNGFIGSEIIDILSAEGHKITVLSRTFKEHTAAKQIIGDILESEFLFECLKSNPEIVIQTAWVTKHKYYVNSSLNYLYSKFTQDLANQILKTSVRHIIVLGSCAEYGFQIEPSVAGISKLSPINLYAEQKVKTLESVKEILGDSDIGITWARIFYPYGPEQDSNRLIPQMIQSLKEDKTFKILDSVGLRDWISTRDISSVISWSLNHNLPIEIDVGTSLGYSNKDIYIKLASIMDKSLDLLEIDESNNPSFSMSVVGSNTALLESGWKPTHSIDTGLNWMLQR